VKAFLIGRGVFTPMFLDKICHLVLLSGFFEIHLILSMVEVLAFPVQLNFNCAFAVGTPLPETLTYKIYSPIWLKAYCPFMSFGGVYGCLVEIRTMSRSAGNGVFV
jgi:hypothetical protein